MANNTCLVDHYDSGEFSLSSPYKIQYVMNQVKTTIYNSILLIVYCINLCMYVCVWWWWGAQMPSNILFCYLVNISIVLPKIRKSSIISYSCEYGLKCSNCCYSFLPLLSLIFRMNNKNMFPRSHNKKNHPFQKELSLFKIYFKFTLRFC